MSLEGEDGQPESLTRLFRILDDLGGVLLIDEDGDGRLPLAAEAAFRSAVRFRQRVAIVCPAALKASRWEPLIERHRLPLVSVWSYEEVRDRAAQGAEGRAAFLEQVDQTELVLVDEAHLLCDSEASAVRALLRGDRVPRQMVLMTGTPARSSQADLETLIRLFVSGDGDLSDRGVPSIRQAVWEGFRVMPSHPSTRHVLDLMEAVSVHAEPAARADSPAPRSTFRRWSTRPLKARATSWPLR